MAARYAVNISGTVDWNGTNTAIWSTTSGGASGASVPTAGDDVFFDANSGSGTARIITANALCHSFDSTGFTGTLAASGTRTLTVGGQSTDTSDAVLTLGSGMTWNTGGGTLTLTLDKRSGGTLTITTNGVTMTGLSAINFGANVAAATGTYVVSGSATFNGSARFVRGGLTVSSGQTVTFSGGNVTMTGTGGTFTFTCNGVTASATQWDFTSAGTTITLDDDSSTTLVCAGNSVNFQTGGLTFAGTVSHTGSTQLSVGGAPGTFNILDVPPGNVLVFAGAHTQTFTNPNGFPSGAAGNPITLKTTVASPVNISCSSQIVANHLFFDEQATGLVNGSGTGAPHYAGRGSTYDVKPTGWLFPGAGSTRELMGV